MMCGVNGVECCMLILTVLTDPWRYCLWLTNSNKHSIVLSERSFLSL